MPKKIVRRFKAGYYGEETINSLSRRLNQGYNQISSKIKDAATAISRSYNYYNPYPQDYNDRIEKEREIYFIPFFPEFRRRIVAVRENMPWDLRFEKENDRRQHAFYVKYLEMWCVDENGRTFPSSLTSIKGLRKRGMTIKQEVSVAMGLDAQMKSYIEEIRGNPVSAYDSKYDKFTSNPPNEFNRVQKTDDIVSSFVNNIITSFVNNSSGQGMCDNLLPSYKVNPNDGVPLPDIVYPTKEQILNGDSPVTDL